MSEHLPDSFDPKQPDLPTAAVDPAPDVDPDGQDTRHFPADITDDDGHEDDNKKETTA